MKHKGLCNNMGINNSQPSDLGREFLKNLEEESDWLNIFKFGGQIEGFYHTYLSIEYDSFKNGAQVLRELQLNIGSIIYLDIEMT